MIGGDFFEYVTLSEDALGFTLGDVAGKGAPAGLLGARIQEIFSAHAPTLVDPAATVARINTTLLGRSLESRFVTMVYGPIAAYLVEAFPARIRYTALSLPYHIGNGVFGGLLPVTAWTAAAV